MNESEAGAELIIPESLENIKETSTQDESGKSLTDIEEDKTENSPEDEISQSDKEENQITESYINTEEKKEEDNDRQRIRINKFISSNGILSRRKTDEYILQGRSQLTE